MSPDQPSKIKLLQFMNNCHRTEYFETFMKTWWYIDFGAQLTNSEQKEYQNASSSSGSSIWAASSSSACIAAAYSVSIATS